MGNIFLYSNCRNVKLLSEIEMVVCDGFFFKANIQVQFCGCSCKEEVVYFCLFGQYYCEGLVRIGRRIVFCKVELNNIFSVGLEIIICYVGFLKIEVGV